MKASDELFRLIRTLTPSEKRYFKTNAKRENPTSNYLQLFDAIDAQKEYDEDNLKQKHAGKKFVKYLSAEKNYLHEQIMKQMRLFHADRTIDNKINELLQDEAFYRAKGLNGLRKKTIDKARDLAEEYERFHLFQEILHREISCTFELSEKTLEEPIMSLLDKIDGGQKLMNAYFKLYRLKQETFLASRSGADFRDDSVVSHLNELRDEVLSLEPNVRESIRLKSEYSTALSDYHDCIGSRNEAFAEMMSIYERYQSKPDLKSEYLQRYRILLSNLISRAYSAGNDTVFESLITELKSLPIDSFNAEGEVFQNVYFLEHLGYLGKGELEKAESLIPSILEGLDKYSEKINKARLLSFQYNIMIMYFVMHKFSHAREWADKILEDKSEIKQNVLTVARILYPIIHFEIGHHDLVENLTRSAYRYLLKQKRLHAFERLMLKYLQELPLSPDAHYFAKNLNDLGIKMTDLKRDNAERVILGFEEVELWVQSHLENKPMSQLMTQRAN